MSIITTLNSLRSQESTPQSASARHTISTFSNHVVRPKLPSKRSAIAYLIPYGASISLRSSACYLPSRRDHSSLPSAPLLMATAGAQPETVLKAEGAAWWSENFPSQDAIVLEELRKAFQVCSRALWLHVSLLLLLLETCCNSLNR
jgi:hypothetical protein